MAQAIGIALESNRFDVVEQIYRLTNDTSLLSYAMEATLDTNHSLSYRDDVLRKLYPLFPPPTPKYVAAPWPQSTPRLPHDREAELAPSTLVYWSRAPVYGAMPMRTMRAHSVTLVDTTAWIFGGCDDKDCSKDIYCFDTGK